MKNSSFIFLTIFSFSTLFSQTDSLSLKINKLEEVVLNSTRIDLPLSLNSRTIQVISATDIKNSGLTNVVALLQQISGVDIRRRGVEGMQADLYIRGGSFDQTLLLIDGIKLEDAQTGHHTLNLLPPVDLIERIEVLKGPAARIYGQNAFTGAINIVTKKKLANTLSVNAEGGSFDQLNGAVTVGSEFENSSIIAHVGALTSGGYRENSDYMNYNYFLKGVFNKKKQPLEMIATFFDKKFGAQNFYTPEAYGFNEYEETQSSLIGVSTTFKTEKLKITPRVYWKRGQDIFLLKRQDPSFFRNQHITHKVGVETNAAYTSSLGITGFGVDISRVSISSNNLGDRNRMMANLFLEHRFKLFNDKLDITPGVAVTYFSDFKFHAFPGIDLGLQVSDNLKLYGNVGTTYRIPTYTDLFYNSPTTSGNPDLAPEEAFSTEIGMKYTTSNFSYSAALFNRKSDNLIDYIRANTATSVFTATNITIVKTTGFELDGAYRFKANKFNQTIAFGYAYLNDDILDQNKDLSRYSLNTLKHQFTTRFSSQFFKNVRQNIIYKYAERTVGTSYNVLDASVIVDFKKSSFTLTANNIFDEAYIESGFVPMPPRALLFGMRFRL